MKKIVFASVLAVGVLAFAADSKDNGSDAIKRISEAQTVFQEIMAAGETSIPRDLLERAHCVAIIPGMKKGAFIVGAKYGKGVLMCRKPGSGWSGPGTVKIEGGSVGFQIGGGEIDVVLLVMNERGAQSVVNSEFKVGGSASVMAGPVGRSATAQTDAFMRAEMLGYSRSRGIFAGISLDGSTIREDSEDNQKVHGKPLTNKQILFGGTPVPAVAQPLVATLNQYSAMEKKK